MILEAFFVCANDGERKEINEVLSKNLTPAFSYKFQEIFNFFPRQDEALDVNERIKEIKEKCIRASRQECQDCMNNKREDCWIRILAKLTKTNPQLHSWNEIADKCIYEFQQGIYVVVKSSPIPRQIGEGDVLFRQCSDLFSIDHALVLYLNPFETAPFVIEKIRKAASISSKNPRFEIIDQKYIRQMYKEYLRKR